MSIQDALLLASKELQLAQKQEAYRTDIRLWAKERLGYHLWAKQVEIAEALIKYRRVAVKSGHGVGKSFVASVIAAWWIDTHKNLDSIVVSSAPTQPQLGIVWEYLRSHHRKAEMFGRITLDNEYKGEDDTLRAMGRKPSDTNVHAFQGIHRRNGVLGILDEGCGIPESIFVGLDAITTGKHDAALVVGNPDDINTPFGRIWSSNDPTWHKITISSFDSPNLTGEDFPEDAKGGLVTQEWIEARKIAWGEDSPRYRSKVLGEFTADGTNTLFGPTVLNKAVETEIEPHAKDKPRLGVDVARFGQDYTALYSYHSGNLRLVDKWSKLDTMTTAERVDAYARELGVSEVRVDGAGVGGGVVDRLAQLAQNPDRTEEYAVIAMYGNSASPDLKKWVNGRAFWYDTMREKMLRGLIDMDFADKTLREELEGILYKFGKTHGGIQIESKDDMLARGVKSPDFADAAMYACADLPIDPSHPLADVPEGEAFSLGLEEMLFGEEISISPF